MTVYDWEFIERQSTQIRKIGNLVGLIEVAPRLFREFTLRTGHLMGIVEGVDEEEVVVALERSVFNFWAMCVSMPVIFHEDCFQRWLECKIDATQ